VKCRLKLEIFGRAVVSVSAQLYTAKDVFTVFPIFYGPLIWSLRFTVQWLGRGILAARLDMIDAAFLRPGRFDKTLYIGLPDAAGRHDILRALSRVISKLISLYFI